MRKEQEIIKNIIFDLGNVIINYNQKQIIDCFTKKDVEIEYIYSQIFNSPEWKLMDLGDITNDQAIKIINEKNDFKYVKLTQEFLSEWYKKQYINRNVVNIARKLKEKQYKLYVLSNMSDLCYEYFKNEDFFSLCKGIIISSHEHIKKPDEKIYKLLLERYNLNPAECLFIDDTEKNYETANKIGIKGRKIIPNDDKDIIEMLSEFNIKI